MSSAKKISSCAKDHTPAKHHPLFDDFETQGDVADIPTIHVLNDDCLEYILSWFNTLHLFKLAFVCRRWYNVCFSKISRIAHLDVGVLKGGRPHGEYWWKKHDKKSMAIRLKRTTSLMKSILSLNTGSLTALTLHDMDYLDFIETSGEFRFKELSAFGIFTDSCVIDKIALFIKDNIGSHLNSLVLSINPDSSQSGLKEIFSEAFYLEHLCIPASPMCGQEILNLDAYYTPMLIPKSAPIKSFNLQYFPVVAQCRVFEYFIRNFCNTLEYLNLYPRNPWEVDEALNIPSPETLPTLPEMKIFSVSVSFDDPSEYQAKPIRQLLTILKLMPNLKVLYVCSDGNLGFTCVNFIEMLAQYCPLIEELHFHDCWFPPEHFSALQNLKFLKRLEIDHNRVVRFAETNPIYKEYLALSFKAFAPIMPHLKVLEYLKILSRCFISDQAGVDDLFQVISNAGPNFKGLSTCTRDSYDSIDNVTESDLHWFDPYDPRLRSFIPANILSNAKVSGRVNLIEEVLKKCSRSDEMARANPILIIIDGLDAVHHTGCTELSGNVTEAGCSCLQYLGYYNDIAPDWLRVDYSSRDEVNYDIFLEHFTLLANHDFLNRRVACKYMQLPNIRI